MSEIHCHCHCHWQRVLVSFSVYTLVAKIVVDGICVARRSLMKYTVRDLGGRGRHHTFGNLICTLQFYNKHIIHTS
jgi:hypothetical protein